MRSLQEALSRIEELATNLDLYLYDPDDELGPPNVEDTEAAKRFVEALYAEGVAASGIFPTRAGGYVFQWTTKTQMVTLRIQLLPKIRHITVAPYRHKSEEVEIGMAPSRISELFQANGDLASFLLSKQETTLGDV